MQTSKTALGKRTAVTWDWGLGTERHLSRLAWNTTSEELNSGDLLMLRWVDSMYLLVWFWAIFSQCISPRKAHGKWKFQNYIVFFMAFLYLDCRNFKNKDLWGFIFFFSFNLAQWIKALATQIGGAEFGSSAPCKTWAGMAVGTPESQSTGNGAGGLLRQGSWLDKLKWWAVTSGESLPSYIIQGMVVIEEDAVNLLPHTQAHTRGHLYTVAPHMCKHTYRRLTFPNFF